MYYKSMALCLLSVLLYGQDGFVLEKDDRSIKALGIVAMIEYYEHERPASADISRDLSKWTDADKAHVMTLAKEKLNYIEKFAVFSFGDYAFAIPAIKENESDSIRRYGDSLIIKISTGKYVLWQMSKS